MSKRWDPDELKIEDALCQELDERPDWENIKNVFTDKFYLLVKSFSHYLTWNLKQYLDSKYHKRCIW